MALKAVPGQQRSLVPLSSRPRSPPAPRAGCPGTRDIARPLPTIIMGVPGEGRGPNPCDSHPQEPMPLISCTLRSPPGHFLPPVCAPHPGDSHACSCPPHKPPPNPPLPHLGITPPARAPTPKAGFVPPAPCSSRLRGSTETGWDGVRQVSSRQARASPGQQGQQAGRAARSGAVQF